MPPPRFTIRSLMLAVAVAGISSLLVADGIKSLRAASRIRPCPIPRFPCPGPDRSDELSEAYAMPGGPDAFARGN